MSNALVSLTQKLAAKRGPKPLPRTQCIVDGCESIAKHPVSGLCGLHYERKKRSGNFEASRRPTGSGTLTKHGYVAIAINSKKKQEHVLIVEAVLGKQLPPGAEVHHVNRDRADNRHENLVVCPDRAYHKLLHARMNAMEACGNPNYRKCPFCKEYDDPQSMRHNKSSRYFYHLQCKQDYRQRMKEQQK